AANLVQMANADGRAQRLLQRLQGVTAVGSRLRDIIGHRRSARQHDVVAYGDVCRYHGVASGDELPPDLGRASHHEAGGEEAVLAQIAVVRNMTNVVQL